MFFFFSSFLRSQIHAKPFIYTFWVGIPSPKIRTHHQISTEMGNWSFVYLYTLKFICIDSLLLACLIWIYYLGHDNDEVFFSIYYFCNCKKVSFSISRIESYSRKIDSSHWKWCQIFWLLLWNCTTHQFLGVIQNAIEFSPFGHLVLALIL